MAVTKIRKISSWTLLISSIISIIVLGMFYAGGVVDPAAEMKEPIYTGLLINWTSVLFFVTIISTMLFAVWQFLTLLKTNAKSAIMVQEVESGSFWSSFIRKKRLTRRNFCAQKR